MTSLGFRSYDDRQYAAGALDEGVAHESTAAKAEESRMDAARAPLDHEEAAASLGERDRRILEFERQWWKYAGAKEQAIRDLFEMSGTRYYQLLNGLIDSPQALAFDPMLVKRLRRMRATRQRARSARRLGIEIDNR
jgi:hypothetical protein